MEKHVVRDSLGIHPKQMSRGPDHIYLWDDRAGVWFYRDHRVPNKANPDTFHLLTDLVVERYRDALRTREISLGYFPIP